MPAAPPLPPVTVLEFVKVAPLVLNCTPTPPSPPGAAAPNHGAATVAAVAAGDCAGIGAGARPGDDGAVAAATATAAGAG